MTKLYHYCRNIAVMVDSVMGTSLKKYGGRLYRAFCRILSSARRSIDPMIIKFYYKFDAKSYGDLYLHLGCGSKHFDGYINVDLWITDATDVICDITRLPWPDNSISLIESYHVIEHISHRKVKDALSDWFRVLNPGGRMVIEVPHFDKAINEYLQGNEERLINIFGWQRTYGDIHLYGYNPARLIRLLEEVGFMECIEAVPQSSQSIEEPSFRIECSKSLT